MRLELYVPRKTAIHALHPATKIAAAVALAIAPFFSPTIAAQAIAVALALAVAAGARVLREVLAPWKLIVFILVLMLAVWAIAEWSRTGDPARGLREGLVQALRVTAVFLVGLTFLAVTRIEETVHGLSVLGIPFRVAFALGLAFRLVPLFLQSAAAVREAQEARGFDVGTGAFRERVRRHVPLMIPIFMTALRGADRMAMALEARGFSAPGPRSRMRRARFGPADAAALLLGAAAITASVFA